jgi:hypothetical protein
LGCDPQNCLKPPLAGGRCIAVDLALYSDSRARKSEE